MPNISISISCLAILIRCFSLFLINSPSFSAGQTNETDRLALLAIKSQLHDPSGVTSSWNNTMNFCQWTGVTCGHRHQRLTELNLSSQRIGGVLSPYVGNLSFLRYINLADNGFRGDIPQEIGNLFRLEKLALSNNSFSGTIPTNLSRCSNLIHFCASNNKLEGQIPKEIGNLLKLQRLSVDINYLTGQLPDSVGNLSAIEVIRITENSLGGKIPTTLGLLRRLVNLNVAENQFSGMFPRSICNISSVELIFLTENRFSGIFPFDILLNLPNLKKLGIGGNNFVGSIPDSLSNASNLELLDLPSNQFKGKVSIDFSSLKNLWLLNLEQNNLGTGTANDLDFVIFLSNCSSLKVLSLSDNQFGGELPHSIANLSLKMIELSVGRNQISGTIPPGIRNLVNLITFTLEVNQFHGTIPDVISELKNLQQLSVFNNFLRGGIPSGLGNLTKLGSLDLGSNSLQGNIPSSLGNCQNLILFIASYNKLTGDLPQQLLSITTLSLVLDLSNNLLNGSLPLQVGNLKNLVMLDISSNQFSGVIPVTLSTCVSLEYLDISINSFYGVIPLSFRFLKSIKALNVSSNNLSGKIPEFLENLSFLEFLNLSYNYFEGEVPVKGVFSNKTKISLHGNVKLCGGIDELHLPSCPSKGSRKPKITLLKVLIPVVVSCLLLSSCLTIVYARKRRSTHKSVDTSPMEKLFPMVSYAELSKATSEFSSSNMIGQGRFGTVYKGILGDDEMVVAVKVINLKQKGASKSFVSECEALRNIRHRNLIKIITICSSTDFEGVDFKALVFEYMENGSLEDWLHQSNDQVEVRKLSLIQRMNIAIDVASAIEYLHHHCQPPMVHGDLKPSNVLLDYDMVAHVGDFGLAKFLSNHHLDIASKTPSSSIGIKGTVGYVAPEYGMGSEASMTGDVYSFGILLLEMFIRRRPTDATFNEGLTLHEFAKMALPEKIMEIVDPSILMELMANNCMIPEDRGRAKTEECLNAIIKTGVLCSTESPFERMEMRGVVAKLCHTRESFLGRRV
ncbi:putative receptor-like protein kinase [Citrus sinensis]|uniref:Receptor-like protein kinase n=1 Tax=Citrus sinensis TaxID=2711 RepID=A0ACB8JIT6_CITSI|nr:putative receptor-like protein kinase [Citrus sinensis]